MTHQTEKPDRFSSLERKLRLGVIIGSITLASAGIGFLYGVSYGRYLSQPIRIMERNLNDDKYQDLSIIDQDLNTIKYLGKAGGEYRKMER